MIPRSEVSARLKAARWLRAVEEEDGSRRALSVAELAQIEPLPENKSITKNRLEEIEQMKVEARPMELEKIAGALGLPENWLIEPDLANVFSEPEPGAVDHLRGQLQDEIDALRTELLEEMEKALDAQASGRRWTRPDAKD